MKTRKARKLVGEWRQHEILSASRRVGPGRFVVRAVHRTVPLLRMAGIFSPRPFQEYEVRGKLVEKAGKMILVLDVR